MSWQEDYQENHGDGYPDVEDEEKFTCKNCGFEFPLEQLNEFHFSFAGKNHTNELCDECYKETIENSQE